MSIWFWLLVFIFFPVIVSLAAFVIAFLGMVLYTVGALGMMILGAGVDGIKRWRY